MASRPPNLRRLMDESVLFTRASCTCPLCTPSRASLATGRYPKPLRRAHP
ncbi:MAG: sulfatase-like hydrolase/transferase [Subdoligranulum sp.]